MFTFSHQCWLGTKHIERWEKKMNECEWVPTNLSSDACQLKLKSPFFQTQLTHLLLSVWYTFILKNKPLFTFPPQFISMLLLNSICPVDLCITCLWCILYQFVKVAKTDLNGVMHQMNFTVLLSKREKNNLFHFNLSVSNIILRHIITVFRKRRPTLQCNSSVDWNSREKKLSIWK